MSQIDRTETGNENMCGQRVSRTAYYKKQTVKIIVNSSKYSPTMGRV